MNHDEAYLRAQLLFFFSISDISKLDFFFNIKHFLKGGGGVKNPNISGKFVLRTPEYYKRLIDTESSFQTNPTKWYFKDYLYYYQIRQDIFVFLSFI